MDKPWKVIVAFVGVFLAGAVSGVFFGMTRAEKGATAVVPAPVVVAPPPAASEPPRKAAAPRPPLPPAQIQPAMMRQLTQRLGLTSDQQKQVRPIVARASEDLQRLRRENLQDTTRVVEQMYADVLALLTPEQREQLEEMKRALQQRVAEERKKREAEARANAGKPTS